MNRVSQRQLLSIGILAVAAVLMAFGRQDLMPLYAGLLVLLGSSAGWFGASAAGDTKTLSSLHGAMRRVRDGRRPEPPDEASPVLLRLYSELEEVYEELASTRQRNKDRLAEIEQANRALSESARHLTEGVAQQL